MFCKAALPVVGPILPPSQRCSGRDRSMNTSQPASTHPHPPVGGCLPDAAPSPRPIRPLMSLATGSAALPMTTRTWTVSPATATSPHSSCAAAKQVSAQRRAKGPEALTWRAEWSVRSRVVGRRRRSTGPPEGCAGCSCVRQFGIRGRPMPGVPGREPGAPARHEAWGRLRRGHDRTRHTKPDTRRYGSDGRRSRHCGPRSA